MLQIQDQGIARPASSDPFRLQCPMSEDSVPNGLPSATKGTEIMEKMLLDQYANSTNLKQYISAFVGELDIMFEELDKVYLGMMLQQAVGAQLDVLGRIIGQGRQVVLPNIWFGFVGEPTADKMADENDPSDGGLFMSEEQSEYSEVPLNDGQYRRLLLAKAMCHNRRGSSVDQIYRSVIRLLGKVPRKMKLTVNGPRDLTLDVAREDVSNVDQSLIIYLAQFNTPLGTTFNVTRTVTP